MSRKHNTKHNRRGRSRYPERLARRGLTTASVRMPSLSELRRRAERRTGVLITLPDEDFDYDPPQAGRYPTWDEIAHARYELLPGDLPFAMMLPPRTEYVALHDTTFHLHEVHPGQIGAVDRTRRRRRG